MNEAVRQLNEAVGLILPEVVLIATACVNFFAGPFLLDDRNRGVPGLRHRWAGLSLAALVFAALLWYGAAPRAVTTGPFRLDDLAWFIRGLTLAVGAVLVLVNWNQIDDAHAAESNACLLLILAGVNLVGAANDLIGLFLALELVSIPTYVFLYLPRRDAAAQEATIKYFLLSIFSSALVLYGFSFLYGAAGTTNLAAIHAALAASAGQAMPGILAIALVTVIGGLAFRITAVPFHFYAPDVFQGAPTSGAAMLSFIPKVAGFVALLRIINVPQVSATITEPMWSLAQRGAPILWWIAVLTMFLGNLLALLQGNLKRLLAYSSIAHAGYMLVGLTVGTRTGGTVNGTDALLFYLTVYGVMTIGVFAVIVALSRPARPVETIDDLAGLSQSHPAAALMMMVLLFSLTGLPPTGGFLGKFNLFMAAWSQGTSEGHWLAILLAANAAIGAWYYLRIVGVMYLHPAARPVEGRAEAPALVGTIFCTVATVGLFFTPQWLWRVIERISA